MRRRLVYSVALASMMLGACELVEKEEEVMARPEVRHMTGIGEITQVPAARSVSRQEDALLAGADAGTGTGLFTAEEGEHVPGAVRRAYGCLDARDRAALGQPLDGIWEGAEDGCDLVAVLLQEGWHDRREARRRDSAFGYEPLAEGLLPDPLAAGSGLPPPGLAAPSADLTPGANGNSAVIDEVIIDILIPPYGHE